MLPGASEGLGVDKDNWPPRKKVPSRSKIQAQSADGTGVHPKLCPSQLGDSEPLASLL